MKVADADSVTRATGDMIEEGIALLSLAREGNLMERWYHDEPIWIYRTAQGEHWETLHVMVVLDSGVEYVELAVMDLPYLSKPQTRRLSLEGLTAAEIGAAAIELWDTIL